MAEREWQRTILRNVEPLVVAERKIAVLQMQVRMAHAAALDAHQHFAAARRRTIHDGLAERLAVSDQRLAVHFCHKRSRLFRRDVTIMPLESDVWPAPAPARQILQR